jgi:sugar phosphate isomerase/epimerase
LGISGYAPDFADVPPAEVEKEKYFEVLHKCLRFCVNLDICVLRVDTVSPPEEFTPDIYEYRFHHLASTWRVAAEECMREDILLVWEYEPGFWLNKPGEVKRMLEEIDHSNFKVLFDTSHSYMGAVVGARHTGEREILPGGVTEYAQLLGSHIGHLHLIDSDGCLHDHTTSTHYPFGERSINFVEVLNALKPTLHHLPWWCVDFCFWPDSEVDARKAIPFLKNLIAQVCV